MILIHVSNQRMYEQCTEQVKEIIFNDMKADDQASVNYVRRIKEHNGTEPNLIDEVDRFKVRPHACDHSSYT